MLFPSFSENCRASWALFWDCHVQFGVRDILSVVSICIDKMEHELLIYLINTEGSRLVLAPHGHMLGVRSRGEMVCLPPWFACRSEARQSVTTRVMSWDAGPSQTCTEPPGLLLFRICVVQTEDVRQVWIYLNHPDVSVAGALGCRAILRGCPASPVCPTRRLIFPTFLIYLQSYLHKFQLNITLH